MKEIRDIVKAFQKAEAGGLATALATVVKVEGSSYRQPGARMLVTEDGQLTGAISGGCLEGDALKKALLVIHKQEKKLITYDTTLEENTDFGVQLGCNGIVHILFEYIDPADPENALIQLKKVLKERKEAVLVTLFAATPRAPHPGTVMPDTWSENVKAGAAWARQNQQSVLKNLDHHQALIQYLPPAVHLLMAGAGNDARPLAEAAHLLGWDITVVDGRATHALPHRFPQAQQVLVTQPEQVTAQVKVDARTVCVLMTHNYRYDLALLEALLETETPYIGMLGPKTKRERMLDDLAEKGVHPGHKQREKMYGPVGLHIGAETSEEIAISIVAEIKAVLSGKAGGSLSLLTHKIHHEIPQIT